MEAKEHEREGRGSASTSQLGAKHPRLQRGASVGCEEMVHMLAALGLAQTKPMLSQ